MSWADVCKRIGPQPIVAEGDWKAGMSSSTTSGAQFAEVTVDVETGIVKAIHRHTGSTQTAQTVGFSCDCTGRWTRPVGCSLRRRSK